MNWLALLGPAIILLPIAASAAAVSGKNSIQQQIENRLAAGEHPNRLINEQSPYLLQHAFNPVQWYPWGEEAFTVARRENKPIFLSIGYSTCHWCHVMAHESFENPEVAAILNRFFISIKVDREERPDIDQMYMAATQAMTGGGGWPMSVFLLADGSPFYTGTYFPPDSSYQRPGFKDLLTGIHKAWLDKNEDIQKTADQMIAVLEAGSNASGTPVKADVLERGYDFLAKSYDARTGGFGTSPKFPRPAVLSFLFSHYLATDNDNAKNMALFTLDNMTAGGMNDQIGGGFHRYSVDADWFVPHFEKMLYDQAQLVNSYLDAYQITRDETYAAVAKDIITYTLRDLRDHGGGFYSAEDADSENPYIPGEHGEGAYYLWTKGEIVEKLGLQNGAIFSFHYGVKQDGNVEQDPGAEFVGRNILHRVNDIDQTAAGLNLNRDLVANSLADSREKLSSVRQQRKHPHLDDKVITAWNGMMIGALARAGRILQDPALLEKAKQTAVFIKENLYDQQSHTLKRRFRKGEAGLAGQLDDYTFLVAGLLDLYQADHDPQWLKWSVELTGKQVDIFWNNDGGFFFDSVTDPTLRVRMREGYDGAEPAGNSVAALNLILLGRLQDNDQWLRMARRVIESFSETINRYPPALPLMLTAWQQINSHPGQIVIAGERGAEDTMALLDVAAKYFNPGCLVLLADGKENQVYLTRNLPFLETAAPINGKAVAYVCTDSTCKLPITDPRALQQQLTAKK